MPPAVAASPHPVGGRGIALYSVASLGASGLMFLASLVAGRGLGPDDYGIVAAMLGVATLLTLPALAYQAIVARETASGVGGEPLAAGHAAAAATLRRRGRLALSLGIVVSGVLAALSPLAADWLALPGGAPLAVTALSALPLLLATTTRGVLLGLGRYGALGAALATEGLVRVLVVALALLADDSVVVACMAVPIAAAASAAVGAAALRDVARATPGGPPAPGLAADRPVLAFYLAFALLSNADVVVARVVLDPRAAGLYAAGAFFGKIALLVPLAAGSALVAEVAHRTTRSEGTRDLLGHAVGISLALIAPLVALTVLVPSLLIDVSLGSAFEDAAELLAPCVVAQLLLGLAFVVFHHGFGRGRRLPAPALAAGTAAVVAALAVLPSSALGLAWTLAGCAGAVLAVLLAWDGRAGAIS